MNKLENISVKKLLVQLIIPSLVTAIVSGSYNLVDGIFIGQTLGLEGNSANTYTFMIYALVYAFSALASEGTASLLTISLGKKDYKNARLILDSSIQVSLILSILQSILLWFSLEGLLIIFGAP
jgi:Na+-driven multidrug efflux pump norM